MERIEKISKRENRFREERKIIFLISLGLSLLGLILVYSASGVYAFKLHNDPLYFFKRQGLFLIFSLMMFFLILLVDINYFVRWSKLNLIVTVSLLVLVLLWGKEGGGAKRWFKMGHFYFQPSELLKVFFFLYCSDYFIRKKAVIKSFRQGLFPLILLFGVISLLLLLEPDLGAVFFWAIWLYIMVFLVGARKRHLFSLFLGVIIMGLILIRAQPYRWERIVAYLNPWQDIRGKGFQIVQSQIAFGQGGLLGVGLGESKQKLMFLPAAHTDFIFSIFAEEFGFLGVLFLLGLYLLLFIKMLMMIHRIKFEYWRYTCLGIVFIFILETLINIGVTCGIFPTKGMALPFISYGGSNLLIHYLLLGIFFNITKENEVAFSL